MKYYFYGKDEVFEDVDLFEQWMHNYNGKAAVVKKLTIVFIENEAANEVKNVA